jgi:hypothetical protein
VDQVLGQASDREIFERGERAETEIDCFISRRAAREARERTEAEAWQESCRKYAVERHRELAQEWIAFHIENAERLRAALTQMINHHEAEIQRYERLIPEGVS